MLTALILLQNLKWMVPTTLMIGIAPAFITVSFAWKIISAPFPSWVYVMGDDFLFSTYQRQLLFFFEVTSGIEIVFYGDLDAIKSNHGENCIYMSNHQSTADWVIASSVAMRCGSLGRTRYVLKDGLRFLPWYGLYFKLHGMVFVKRAKKFDKAKTEKVLQQGAKFNKPMWLVVFPEGTRFNPELKDVVADSQQFALSQGKKPLRSVLFPRLKAIQVCLEQLRGSVDSVYDVTLAYGKTFDHTSGHRRVSPTMQDVLLGLPQKIHVHVRRIPIALVPHEETMLKEWLYQQFQEKDRLLAEFYKSGAEGDPKFSGPSMTQPLSFTALFPSLMFLSGCCMAIQAFKSSRDSYGKLAIGTAAFGILCMAIKK